MVIEDEKIIEMFFERSEQGLWELDNKYNQQNETHNVAYHRYFLFHSKHLNKFRFVAPLLG